MLDGEVFAGRYEIRGVLGRGAMGVVHRALDQRFEREVALKLMAPHLSHDPDFRRRFQREAATGGRIQHENVVFVIDASEHDGVLYVVMQLVPGTDLAQLLAVQGRLPPARAGRLLRDVAHGLDAAHEIGVVHRDVKPANVLVTGGHGSRERALLTDFGLTTARAGASHLSSGAFVLGTPAYMAPEQVRAAPVDRRTDVYALGCVAYECLTGRPPFGQVEPGEQAHAKLERPAPDLREAWPQAPAELAAVVARALHVDPERRHATAGELGDALQCAVALAGGSGPGSDATTVLPVQRAAAVTTVQPAVPPTTVQPAVPPTTVQPLAPPTTVQPLAPAPHVRHVPPPSAPPPRPPAPVAGGPYAPPEPAPRPRRRPRLRRLKRLAAVVLFGALALTATEALLGLSGGSGDAPGGSGTTGSQAQRLQARLPAGLVEDCRSTSAPAQVSAAVTCDAADGTGADEFLVYDWSSAAAMQADFQAHYDRQGGGRYPDGTCARRWEVSSTWRAGDLACYHNTAGAAVLLFEYDAEAVQVLAVREDGETAPLYDWWVSTRIDLAAR